ncbi:MAG: imidazole glycerol phosphate synthase subunit HisH, partial [Alphaproteobacteria bacterium]|nr:imidazole glycerol phosphate synthase subunit HisH [Alphaproteobacteria bacterium]
MSRVGIIDYGCGNIRSVAQAFEYIGCDVTVLKSPSQQSPYDHLVLPGVGAFSYATDQLNTLGWDLKIRKWIQNGQPFLGICVGMQVLMEKGYEFGEHKGLGIIAGECVHLQDFRAGQFGGNTIESPHIGWSK